MSGKMTLREFKLLSRGKPVFIWCNWQGCEGDYFPISRAAFLRSIGADVPQSSDGLCDGTVVVAVASDGGIYVN